MGTFQRMFPIKTPFFILKLVSGAVIAGFSLFLVLSGGCTSTPTLREYALARTALQLAKTHDAPRYAPALWQEAENAYEAGDMLFKKGEFKESRAYFEDAMEYAERAENVSRLQKMKSGEPQ